METEFGLWDRIFVEILTIWFFGAGALRLIGFGNHCWGGVWSHRKFVYGLFPILVASRCDVTDDVLGGSQETGFEALSSEFKAEIR